MSKKAKITRFLIGVGLIALIFSVFTGAFQYTLASFFGGNQTSNYWYIKAAELGHVGAMRRIKASDRETTIYWLEKIAQKEELTSYQMVDLAKLWETECEYSEPLVVLPRVQKALSDKEIEDLLEEVGRERRLEEKREKELSFQGFIESDCKSLHCYLSQLDTPAGSCLSSLAGSPSGLERIQYWYEKAANKGSFEAQHRVGWRYAQGYTVPRNYIRAYHWWNIAASYGHSDAEKLRELLEKELTPKEVAVAQQLSYEWLKNRSPEKKGRKNKR